MSIKRILLPINDEHDITPVADVAFALAEEFGAEVEGIFPQQHDWQQYRLATYGLSTNEIEKLDEKVKETAAAAAKRAEKAFKTQARHHRGVPIEFRAPQGRIADSIARHAYFADLTIIGNRANYGDNFWRLIGDCALFHSGRPVFVAPSRTIPKNLGTRIVIAWKDGTEASRAVGAAIPFIERADEISLLVVGDDDESRQSAENMEGYLSLHRPNATVDVVKSNGGRVGKLLIDKAAEKDGSILVMGAYSHLRWKERIFGGATEYVLHNTDMPVLMAH